MYNKLPGELLFGEHLSRYCHIQVMRVSRAGRSVRFDYLEPKKRVNAETIVSGWLTARSCPPP